MIAGGEADDAGGAARARLRRAMVVCAARRGFAATTVSDVCAQARVSRSTFYDAFDGLDTCFLAVMEDAYGQVHELISTAFEHERHWLDGVRNALFELLRFFDEDRARTRVLLVETLTAGSWALERRTDHLRALLEMIVGRWPAPEGVELNPLAAAGVLELVMGILQSRIVSREEEPFVALLGPLMGLIAAVYLGAQVGELETRRAGELAVRAAGERGAEPRDRGRDDVEIPDMLLDPRARRARRCMLYVLEHPGASNSQIATASGIGRPAQASRLLGRLSALGLLDKRDASPGGPNAWFVTPVGERVTGALGTLGL